jgi:hypothetical protein
MDLRDKWLNFIAMSIYDLSGTSGLEWQIAHQTHHNQPHSSIDYQTNAYNHIGIRIHKYMAYRKYRRYQQIYYWIVISFYFLFKLFATTILLRANLGTSGSVFPSRSSRSPIRTLPMRTRSATSNSSFWARRSGRPISWSTTQRES